MRKPSFVTLARLDDTRFITACRHGLVHLTWTRSTVRFSRGEFRRVAALLQMATDQASADVCDGDLQVTWQVDDECALEVGPLSLRMSADELEALAHAALEATRRLDRILDSGVWDEEEEPEPPAAGTLFRRFPFSTN